MIISVERTKHSPLLLLHDVLMYAGPHERLQTRIPHGSKVLLCTTNKAIDSLAEKKYDCGHRNIPAFGNESRLGATSCQLTLANRVAAHASVQKAQDLVPKVNRARSLWSNIKQAAEDESEYRQPQERGHEGADDRQYYHRAMCRLIKQNAMDLESKLSRAVWYVKEFQALKEHPRVVADWVQGVTCMCLQDSGEKHFCMFPHDAILCQTHDLKLHPRARNYRTA